MPNKIVSKSGAEGVSPVLDELRMSGPFAEKLSVIPLTYSSILLGSGELGEDRKRVLVPFVELALHGLTHADASEIEDPNADPPMVYQANLALENAMWMLADICGDLRVACSDLVATTGQGANFDSNRLQHTRRYAETLVLQAQGCVEALKALENKTRASDQRASKIVLKRGKPVPK